MILCSYFLIGNRVRVKSLGMAPGLANARPPGSSTFRDWQAGKCPAVARGGGGAGRRWNWLMHEVSYSFCYALVRTLFCLFCLTKTGFVQCFPFGSRSLFHAFVVSNLCLCFVLSASPTSGWCSAFPFGSPQVYTLLFFFVLLSLLLFRVLCPTSSGLCSDFSPSLLEFVLLIFCFVLIQF